MIYPTRWNLARYFYSGLDDPKLWADIANILPITKTFALKYEHTFASLTTPEQIIEFYSDYTALSHDMATPSYYLFYRSSLDTQDLEVTKKMWEIDYIYTEASNQLLFVAQGWKQIGYDRIIAWANDPKLAKIKNDLFFYCRWSQIYSRRMRRKGSEFQISTTRTCWISSWWTHRFIWIHYDHRWCREKTHWRRSTKLPTTYW